MDGSVRMDSTSITLTLAASGPGGEGWLLMHGFVPFNPFEIEMVSEGKRVGKGNFMQSSAPHTHFNRLAGKPVCSTNRLQMAIARMVFHTRPSPVQNNDLARRKKLLWHFQINHDDY